MNFRMIVETTRFGSVTIDDSSIISFPRGLLGFENDTEYVLVKHRPDTMFRWLQSVDSPELAFVVIDPMEFFTGYDLELSSIEAEYLNISELDEVEVLTMVTVDSKTSEATTNLAGPIVINREKHIGMQVVLDDPNYGAKHTLIRQSEARTGRKLAYAA